VAAVGLAARLVLASVFGVAGVAKLADRGGVHSALTAFGVPARVAPLGARLLPALELLVAICLLIPLTSSWSAILALALLLVFVTAIAVNMARGREPECHCFGRLHSAPVGWGTLSRNGLLAALGGVVVAAEPSASKLSPVGWVAHLNAAEVALCAVAGVLGFVAAAQGWFLLQLLRQHGRLLGRVELLEERGPDGKRAAERSDDRSDAAIGADASELVWRDLDGRTINLPDLEEAPLTLLFWNPRCGFCERLLPDLKRWQTSAPAADVRRLLVISTGAVEENRALGLELPIVLEQDFRTGRLFGVGGTPSAVRIDGDGRPLAPVAAGWLAVFELLAGDLDPRVAA
jgi:uncharacterized membrane protein YphA (DoxX/SURF4 family)/thiol-disulfide isomerase/thioredoxin